MVKIVEFSKLDKETGLDFNPADDLTVFMRNDPMFYRKHYFPVMAKIADMQDQGKSIDAASLISPVVDQGINIYCKKFNIKQQPNEIFPKSERTEIVKKIYSEEMPQIKKGDYRLKKMKLRQIFEAPRKVAVAAFGRMNPPTIGHEKLVNKITEIDGDHYLFLSQTQKPKDNPLPFDVKLEFSKKFFPSVNVGHPTVRTPIQMLQMLEKLGYTDIVYVAGSDRVEQFEKLFNDYNGKEYNFNSIQVVSAGERDPDADGAEGMSASKMRAAAASGDFDSFAQGVPTPALAQKLYDAVRTGMGIKDTVPAEGVTESVQEASYEGNIGIMELFKFFSKAEKEDPKLVAKVKDMIKQRRDKEVWRIIQDYTGTQLTGKEFEGSIKEAIFREAGHGKYWCSTDKKWKYRKGPKQTRSS